MSTVPNPQWLYFMTNSYAPITEHWASPTAVMIHDREPSHAGADSAALRTLTDSGVRSREDMISKVAVLARPNGATPELRMDPDHPDNRREVQRLMTTWRSGYRGEDRTYGVQDGLWFIPGWALDAYLHPRFVAVPDGAFLTFVWTGDRGAPFSYRWSDIRVTSPVVV